MTRTRNDAPCASASRHATLILGALAASAFTLLTSCSPAETAAPAVTARPDEQWDKLLKPQPRGFLGADGAASVPLGDGRVLWIFGDTLLGTLRNGKREGPMVRNTIAIHTPGNDGSPGKAEWHWDLRDRIPGDFFHPDTFAENHWYWPGTGVLHDGRLNLFLTKLDHGEGPAGFSFRTIDCTLFRVDNPLDAPDAWRITKTNLGYGDQHFNINAASLVEGEMVHLLGYDDGPEDKPAERAAILARMPVASLTSPQAGQSVEFWSSGGTWTKSPDQLNRLFTPGMTECSLHFDAARNRYLTFGIRPFSPDLVMYSAPKLTGPWTEATKIYHIEEAKEGGLVHAYAARAHPELSPDGNTILLTYVSNTTDFWSMFSMPEIYYPRFLRIDLK